MERASRAHAFVNCPWLNLLLRATAMFFALTLPQVLATHYEVVQKTVFDRKVSLVACVGIEGSGHHFVRGAMEAMSRDANFASRLHGSVWNTATLASALTLNARKSIELDFKKLMQREGRENEDGHIEFIHLRSFPFGDDVHHDKFMKYSDLRLIAEVAEEEGVDFRAIYLKRPAKDILLSNTNHRHFDLMAGDNYLTSPQKAREHYLQILFINLGAMASMISELDPAFFVCHDYTELGDVAQAQKVANFVSPSNKVSDMFSEYLLGTAEVRGESHEELDYVQDTEYVIQRFQKKLDSIEHWLCDGK